MGRRIYTGNDNRENGKGWEAILFRQAQSNGLLIMNNHQAAQWRGSKLHPIRGNLDFHISNAIGRVGFLDAKTFDGPSFTYSQITDGGRRAHQLERATLYNHWKIPAGFLVWFRPSNLISFYSGEKIAKIGPRGSFSTGDGLCLGTLAAFNLGLILLV